MKITKYPQSCLLFEKNGHRIVIDPGKFYPYPCDPHSFVELAKDSAEIILLDDGQSVES